MIVSGNLLDIEKIKQLKARYLRLMDQKQWDDFAGVFTEDAEQESISSGESLGKTIGRQAIVQAVSSALEGIRSTHHAHNPEIDFKSETEASGIWGLFDYCVRIEDESLVLNGSGYYYEEYQKEADGEWRIKRSRVEFSPM